MRETTHHESPVAPVRQARWKDHVLPVLWLLVCARFLIVYVMHDGRTDGVIIMAIFAYPSSLIADFMSHLFPTSWSNPAFATLVILFGYAQWYAVSYVILRATRWLIRFRMRLARGDPAL